MEIRLANETDLDALMAIVRGAVPLMRAEGNLQWDDDYPNGTIFLQDIRLSRLWVAVIDTKVAGAIALTTDAEPDYDQGNWDNSLPALFIHRLAVDASYRGAGVAKALMLKAEEVALAKGISLIRTDTNSENKATQRLFPSMGYRFAGEISLRARPGLRFLCYAKILSRP
jgi:GNAT superfamily N-acetyltransferase